MSALGEWWRRLCQAFFAPEPQPAPQAVSGDEDEDDGAETLGRPKRFGPEVLPVNLSSIFIRRPVATTLLTIALALAGAVSFRLLPVAPLPEMDFPVVFVMARLPGAGPETMATTVATPLERALGRIDGVNEMTSSSSLGQARVVLQFETSKDINEAARDVHSAINAARSTLPTMPSNPTYRKVNPSGAPILILRLTSDTVPNYAMYDAAQTVLSQKISQIPGVGEVSMGGGAMPGVRIDVNPEALYRAGLSMADVASALRRANVFMPRGMLSNREHYWLVGINDQLSTPEEYGALILAWKNGAPVRLRDVASISHGPQDVRSLALADGKPAILLMVFKAPGANVIETVDSIKEMIPSMRKWLPEGVTLDIGMDKSITIRASLREVEASLLLSMALVILVVFLFLRNVRATSIPAVAAPVSLIGTFAVMYVAGYTLDNLSLMALTIATGFVVDDAIVVLENVVRRLEMGETPFRAAMHGAREVGFTIVSMTLSLVAVFIPILCMPGVMGSLFREFAVVLSVSVLISMAVSLTTTPMMCAGLLKGRGEIATLRKHRIQDPEPGLTGRMLRFGAAAGRMWGHWLDSLRDAYARSLKAVLRHKGFTLFIFFAVLAANVWMYVVIPKSFFPEQDTGMIMGGIRMDQSLSFQASSRKLRHIQAMLQADPAVEKVSSFISGGRGSSGIFIALKPLRERKISVQQVINRLRPKMMAEPGAQVFLMAAQDLRMGGRSARSQYQYTLQSDSIAELREWGTRLKEEIAKSRVVADVDSDLEEHGLETYVTADRDRMAHYGVTMQAFDNALGLAFGQTQVSTIYKDRNQYKVVLGFDEPWLQAPESLQEVRIPGRDGLVPLTSVAEIGFGFSSLAVAHQGQFAAVTISFNLASGHSISEAQAVIEEAGIRIGMPETVFGSFQGSAKLFADTVKTELLLILAAIVTLYIVLGVLYESLIHPVTILSTLPPAGGGALIALMIFGMQFSVIALIGVLLLCGLVKKNAILVIDFALTAQRTQRLAPDEAIVEACRLRFRPIMMTTFAAMFGAVPLALGQGDGAELRQPLGVAIVGGLALSQLLTLYTTPVVFLYLDSLRRRFRAWYLSLKYGARKAKLIMAFSGPRP